MDNKHTPGPWGLRSEGSFGYGVHDIAVIGPHPKGNGRLRDVAIVGPAPGTYMDEARANARLIVAAPDMLAALEALDAILDFASPLTREGEHVVPVDPDRFNDACDKARAAVELARKGTTP